MSFFISAEAAQRYDTFRPQVHDVVLNWLSGAGCDGPFQAALDVGCGTGHSMLPLVKLAERVVGIDTSPEMLARASKRGLEVHTATAEAWSEREEKFDLISTCMAFHWFASPAAIAAYKRLSSPGAIWIFYNFAFAGHETSEGFNAWFRDQYLTEFPSPPRHKMTDFLTRDDADLQLLAEAEGYLPLAVADKDLAGYFTTQSNIEGAVQQRTDAQSTPADVQSIYQEIETLLQQQLEKIPTEGRYRYHYRYEIVRFIGNATE